MASDAKILHDDHERAREAVENLTRILPTVAITSAGAHPVVCFLSRETNRELPRAIRLNSQLSLLRRLPRSVLGLISYSSAASSDKMLTK